MKTYTVADLRKNTRQILNEAATEPVSITRYDETFVLSKSTGKIYVDEAADLSDKEVEELQGKLITSPRDVGKAVPGVCVHGAAKGFCKVAKCPNSKK